MYHQVAGGGWWMGVERMHDCTIALLLLAIWMMAYYWIRWKQIVYLFCQEDFILWLWMVVYLFTYVQVSACGFINLIAVQRSVRALIKIVSWYKCV